MYMLWGFALLNIQHISHKCMVSACLHVIFLTSCVLYGVAAETATTTGTAVAKLVRSLRPKGPRLDATNPYPMVWGLL